MPQQFFCGVCSHLGRELKPDEMVTVINGQMVCEYHMVYVEGGDFTLTFEEIMRAVKEDMAQEAEELEQLVEETDSVVSD